PTVFAHAMRAVALAVNNRPEDHPLLVEDVTWLLHAQRDGSYTYDDNIVVEPIDAQSPSPPPTAMPIIARSPGPANVTPTPAKSRGPMIPRNLQSMPRAPRLI